MRQAQDLHNKGGFAKAEELWSAAAEIAPDPIERGRAIRGNAASLHQLGRDALAMVRAEQAHGIHEACVEASSQPANPNHIRSLRELAQSESVLGRFVVREVAVQELTGILTVGEARANAERGLILLDSALFDITKVEKITQQPDQYRINATGHAAMAHALYGEPDAAAVLAREARHIAWRSESGPTSANISTKHQLRAKTHAVVRAYTATADHLLATPVPSARRTGALKLATHPKLGF